AFLIHYFADWPLGAVLFTINLPFYVFAWRAMGRTFTLRTVLAVTLLSLETQLIPNLVTITGPHPAFAAIAGGVLAGTGLLALIRHRAS
ncbi:YitT family protein, partial [Mycobacterium tuberculosis]|nr:YitT family protein [Mycobacterium tuberculosis]